MDIEKKDILVRMLNTPNPYALKFVVNTPLKQRGSASFYSQQEVAHLPLLHSLFDIQGVKQVYVFQNQVTVTHDGSLSETEIERQVTAVIGTRIPIHDSSFISPEEEQNQTSTSKLKTAKEKTPEMLKIEEILDRTIRPGLRADGGDMEVLSVNQNEVRIAYQGACSGCPSAFMGTLEAVENILRHETGCNTLKVIPIDLK